jgi:hypothetical protein
MRKDVRDAVTVPCCAEFRHLLRKEFQTLPVSSEKLLNLEIFGRHGILLCNCSWFTSNRSMARLQKPD